MIVYRKPITHTLDGKELYLMLSPLFGTGTDRAISEVVNYLVGDLENKIHINTFVNYLHQLCNVPIQDLFNVVNRYQAYIKSSTDILAIQMEALKQFNNVRVETYIRSNYSIDIVLMPMSPDLELEAIIAKHVKTMQSKGLAVPYAYLSIANIHAGDLSNLINEGWDHVNVD